MPPEPNSPAARQGAALDPITHFILLPLALFTVVTACIRAVREHPHTWPGIFPILLAIAFFLIVAKMRMYTLRVQDRIIRLEERLRLATLLPPGELAASHALTLSQLIGLRFASDAELPALVRRTLAESLTPKQIKDSIQTWRVDDVRI